MQKKNDYEINLLLQEYNNYVIKINELKNTYIDNDTKLNDIIDKEHNNILYTFTIDHNIDIKLLKEENIKLKNIINELENKIKEQDIKINKLEIENKEQSIKIKEQDTKIKEQDIKINKLVNNNYIKKLLYAFQDLNSKESLEKIFKISNSKLIRHLRNNRNEFCHYIYNDDNNNDVLYKEKILYEKLIELDNDQRLLLDKKISKELVDEIIIFLSNKDYNLLDYSIIEPIIDDVNEWFED
jgi:hypothetical protein